MAFMCSLCGGIVLTDTDKDFPICSLSDCPCFGGEVKIQEGFADAIKILHSKGYRLIGYNFPRSDGWETDYRVSIVFNPHTVPSVLPPDFYMSDLPEVNGVVFFRYYEPMDFEKQVEQSADDLRKWADKLPTTGGVAFFI